MKKISVQLLIGVALGFALGSLITYTLSHNSQNSNHQNTDINKFLVSQYRGQSIDFKDLSEGKYKVGENVDRYTNVVFCIYPLGGIPLLVKNIPKYLIDKENGCISKYPPQGADWY